MDWNPTTHYKDRGVAERYDNQRFSGLAGRVFNGLERAALCRAFIGTPRSAVLMDLPCGTGRLAETLLEQGFHVVGIDISAAMLHVAQRRLDRFGARFETVMSDVNELARNRRGIYDVALCARVLMHFPLEQQIEFLKSVALLTKGTVVFSQSLSTPYQRLRRKIKRFLGNQTPAMHPVTESELRELLAGASLREVRRHRVASLISEGMFVVAEHA